MKKKPTTTKTTVTDPKTGKVVVVYGLGSMKDKPLDLNRDIDLTKPIAEQAFKQMRK
jgi:hypothetical protein